MHMPLQQGMLKALSKLRAAAGMSQRVPQLMSPNLAGGWQTPSQACCDLAEPVHWIAHAPAARYAVTEST